MIAKREMPLGGKRAKMGTGRGRSAQIALRFHPEHAEKLGALADAEGITRTALIERWIDEHTAPLPEGYGVPE